MAELYKNGIIEVIKAEYEDDENLFEVAVHFDGDIFSPNVVFEGSDHALQQAKKLYDWLEANPKEIKGDRLSWKVQSGRNHWRSHTVNRESLREYPSCHLPYYYSKYEQSLEVLTFFERDSQAIAYGWLSAEPLPYYLNKEDNLVVLKNISNNAVLAGWCGATSAYYFFWQY
jgi:hypothetical protein